MTEVAQGILAHTIYKPSVVEGEHSSCSEIYPVYLNRLPNQVVISDGRIMVCPPGVDISSTSLSAGTKLGLQLLQSYSTLGAIIDTKDPAPRLEPELNTILSDTMAWINNKSDHSTLRWIHGPAGSGRSALATTLAQLAARSNNLAASFSFSTVQARVDGTSLIPTLAHQLATRIPALRVSMDRAALADPLFFRRAPEAQMQRLVLGPASAVRRSLRYHCAKLAMLWRHPQLLVIDGLDACTDAGTQCEIMKAFGNAVKELQLPFRILIFGRTDVHLEQVFTQMEKDLGTSLVSQVGLSV